MGCSQFVAKFIEFKWRCVSSKATRAENYIRGRTGGLSERLWRKMPIPVAVSTGA